MIGSHWFSARLIAAGVVCLTGPAFGADLPTKAPIHEAPTVAQSWTGFYIGVNGGYGWGSRNMTYTPNDGGSAILLGIPTAVPPMDSLRSSGAIGGFQLGYNWQMNSKWLVGLETDFDWSGMKGSASGTGDLTPFAVFPISANIDEHIKWFGTVRARLGYLLVDNLLAYATGGLAYGKVEHTGNYINNGPLFALGPSLADPFHTALCNANATCFAGSSSAVSAGWTIGGGLEYVLWKNLSAKVEYLYVNLAGEPVTETAVRSVNGPPEAPATFKADFGRTIFNVVRVGLNYRF